MLVAEQTNKMFSRFSTHSLRRDFATGLKVFFGSSLILFLDKFLSEESQMKLVRTEVKCLYNEQSRAVTNKQGATHSSASCQREWKVFSETLLMRLSINNLDKKRQCQTSRPKHCSVQSWIPTEFETISLTGFQPEQILAVWLSDSMNWQLHLQHFWRINPFPVIYLKRNTWSLEFSTRVLTEPPVYCKSLEWSNWRCESGFPRGL